MIAVEVLSDGHLIVEDAAESLRYSLQPGADLTGQPQEVVVAAAQAWTPKVIEAFLASQPSFPPAAVQAVSARQIRLWLIQNGISLAQVEAAINAIEDPAVRDSTAVEWEYAPYIERTHPMLAPLASALGLSGQDVDDAFEEASAL